MKNEIFRSLKTKFSKSALLLTASGLIIVLAFSSCNTTSEKVTNAQEDLTQAKAALTKAEADHLLEIEKFRKETDDRLVANQNSLAEFNARIEQQKKEAQDEYRNKIMGLEQKNSDMKKKLADYKAAGRENWEKFKIEVAHDMDELSRAFLGLADKNLR